MDEEFRGLDIDKTASTLDDTVEIRNERNCGNTTRQVNYAVDKLFDGYSVLIKDHTDNGNHKLGNEGLLESIINRLNFEHGYKFNGNVNDYLMIYKFGKFKIIKFK